MTNFWQRTLSGAVYASLVIASVLVHPAFFCVLFSIVTCLAVREYHHLVQSPSGLRTCCISAALMLFISMFFHFYDTSFVRVEWVIAFVFFSVGAMLLELFRTPSSPISNWGNLWSSLVMVAFPFALMNGILMYDKYVLLALFITIWVSDSGAYCVGSLLAKRTKGNHKMCPRVSPGKSWEGLIGGLLFALLAGYVFYVVGWMDGLSLTASPLVNSLLFALTVAVFGTFGDLLESLFKRSLGVKDSGRFMPGHGGVLDRFDSLLLATPAVYFFFVYLPSVM